MSLYPVVTLNSTAAGAALVGFDATGAGGAGIRGAKQPVQQPLISLEKGYAALCVSNFFRQCVYTSSLAAEVAV